MLHDVLPRLDATKADQRADQRSEPRHPFAVPGARSDAGTPVPVVPEVAALQRAILERLAYGLGKTPATARDHDWFKATALALRERIVDAAATMTATPEKRVYYLSMEFLVGRLMSDAVHNLGLDATVRAALDGLGVAPERVSAAEPDAALGNGGLGRLAACFMESMASLAIPAYGYGIRYDHGLFRQEMDGGWQCEVPETWLADGNPWEFERPDIAYAVGFGGQVTATMAGDGTLRRIWEPAETVTAVAYDTPVVGWRGRHVNALRLWSARAAAPVDLARFNAGDHVGAVAERARAEAISRVLYPGDASGEGQELRLRQEYFFVAASLHDLVARHLAEHGDLASLPDHAAIQMNDTHPAIAVAELMRLLMDVHGFGFEDAWHVVQRTANYTNHTLLPEALETWPVALMERLLPRHMQIIYLINFTHLEGLAGRGGLRPDELAEVSLIDESQGKRVRMGHLAFLGARRVNGVSALHTDLMRSTVFRHLHALDTDKIVNKTNGITFRRWLHNANPELTALAVEAVGTRVLDDADALSELSAFANDAGFQDRYAALRQGKKAALARIVHERIGIEIDPSALFDVQIKRIHEYKRQLLNLVETVALYQAMRAEPNRDWTPRVKLFAGKAAPSYTQAKLIIKLANDVAAAVNADAALRGRLKVAFLPNYCVSLAEAVIPAADLSEQISTAGMEASGTGNMKLALNGALTVGTLDGANVEIRQAVGPENIFIFGLNAQEAQARLVESGHAARAVAGSGRLRAALDLIASGAFSPDDPNRFRALVDDLLHHDRFLVTSDFDDYWRVQRDIDAAWREPRRWWRSAVINTAQMGWFSSDRAMREYADDIWGVRIPVL